MAKEISLGSLFDESHRPVSPVDVRDFDTLDPISDYVHTPYGQLLDIPPLTSDNQPLPSRHDVWTAELDPSEWDYDIEEDTPIDPMSSDDHGICVTQRSVFTSIDHQSPSIFMIQRGGMIDSGANCCITNSM